MEASDSSNHKDQEKQMKTLLHDIMFDISWRELANNYFHQPSSWIYQRLNGRDEEGKPISFTPKEIEQLQGALIDLSKRIRWCADKLSQLDNNPNKNVKAEGQNWLLLK